MKKIIDGKVYNTKTATEIGHASSHCPCNDFGYWEETLYVTKKGAYFLDGEGGPMTKYASHYGNSSSSGSNMFVLSREQALAWAERNMEADEIAEFFGDMIEEGGWQLHIGSTCLSR